MKAITCVFIFFSMIADDMARAIDNPLRDPKGLASPQTEVMVRVKSARVVLADYDLLRKDFPELQNLGNNEIDEWLLHQTAYISKPQASQEIVNTKIDVGAEEVIAYRPKDYGRAIVFKAGESGLIDAKGTGSLHPWGMDHSNGLASLGETIREFSYEKLIDKIFKHSNSGFQTVRSYAVIDYGFNIKSGDSTARAGVILRQAHERSTGAYSLIENDKALKIEKLLRHYGVTSAGAHRNKWPYEWLNIQGTKEGAVLDFGGFLTVEKFDKPLIEALQGMSASTLLMSSEEVLKLQAEPSIRIPLQIWGTTVTGKIDPAFDNPWIWSHELAESLGKGTASRADVERHIHNLLDSVDQIFAHHVLPIVAQATQNDLPSILMNNMFCDFASRLKQFIPLK
jgi:hypothetical protein